jgi:CxxC-x17-CxxC domain-containing protein
VVVVAVAMEAAATAADRAKRQMFPVVCGDCGKDTEVPFEPRGDRPVYCRDCFTKHAPSRSRY